MQIKIYQEMIGGIGVNIHKYSELPAICQLRQIMMVCCWHSGPLIELTALFLGVEAILPYIYSYIPGIAQREEI